MPEGTPFKLWLSYKASASVLTQSQIDADLGYFLSKYGSDPAFERVQSPKPTMIWQGSRKYPTSILQAISAKYRSKLRILGDETTWSPSRAPYLDGNAYYWSSQNPYSNPQSFRAAGSARGVGQGERNQSGRQPQSLGRALHSWVRQATRWRQLVCAALRRSHSEDSSSTATRRPTRTISA